MKSKNIYLTISTIIAGILFGPATMADAAATGTAEIAALTAKRSLYRDVFSTDDEKVGDIVDYIVQFNRTPQLRFAVIKTEVYLGTSGTTRAIPAAAFTRSKNRFHVNLTKEAYDNLPVITGVRQKWLTNPANTQELASLCNTPPEESRLSGEYESLSNILGASVIGSADNTLGIVEDLWINYNANRVPFMQFMPTFDSLINPQYGSRLRYNVPTNKLLFGRARGGLVYLTVSAKDIINAPMVEDATAHVAKIGIIGSDTRTFKSRIAAVPVIR